MSTPQPPSQRASTAGKPMSRLGCLLGFLAWLFVMTVPLLGFMLAVRGEFTWRRSEFVEDRVWLISAENSSGDERGLGYSAARVVSDQTAADGPICVRTRVNFLLWRGRSEHLEFCDCYLRSVNGGYEPNGSCP